MKELIKDINGRKVIKNLADRFGVDEGQINIQTLTPSELSLLTETLYKKVLFIGYYHENMTNFSGQKEKYQIYFNSLFDKLKDVCDEIRDRNIGNDEARKVKLPIKSVNFTEGVRAAISGIDRQPDQSADFTATQILIGGVDGDVRTVERYKNSEAFQNYYRAQKSKLEEHFAEKKIEYYTLRFAIDLGLKFSRGDGEDESLKTESKKLAEGFNQKKSLWARYKFNFLKSQEQKLYESLRKFVKKKLENNRNDIKSIIDTRIRHAAKQALFSLKDSTIYTKLKANPQEQLTNKEKLLFQRRLKEFLQYEIDNVDPFEPPYKQFAKFMERRGVYGVVGLFAIGLVPPFSIFFAPSAEDYFKHPLLKYPLKASYWITYPCRVVLEYCVMIPIEAPLKVVEAAKKAIFYSDEFEENKGFLERFKKSLGDQKFGEMRSFHRGYEKEMEEVEIHTNKFQGQVSSTAKVDISGLQKDVVQNTRHAIKVQNKKKTVNNEKKNSADGFGLNF